ncbi:MAG TPA: hypothetical protein IGS40_24615 [Trichormus sp. M33_DOE_039]|nr:hypothetical protein [Trichormus sp. M33_DOE_039]
MFVFKGEIVEFVRGTIAFFTPMFVFKGEIVEFVWRTIAFFPEILMLRSLNATHATVYTRYIII